jgi:hypothetical protein
VPPARLNVSLEALPFPRCDVATSQQHNPSSMVACCRREKLLQNTPLGPEEIKRLTDAYEQTLDTLRLKDRSDPITQLIAKKIFEIGQAGIKDPAEISKLTIEQLGIS